MITETTAISCAAFGALSTGLGIAAGLGWIRCARLLANARERAGHWYDESGRQMAKAGAANRRATDLEDRLRKIEQSRHASAKHARAVQLQRQADKVAEKARELRRNTADRAQPTRALRAA